MAAFIDRRYLMAAIGAEPCNFHLRPAMRLHFVLLGFYLLVKLRVGSLNIHFCYG